MSLRPRHDTELARLLRRFAETYADYRDSDDYGHGPATLKARRIANAEAEAALLEWLREIVINAIGYGYYEASKVAQWDDDDFERAAEDRLGLQREDGE